MRKTADVVRTEAPEAAQLRAQIVDIISNEYIGDVRSEFWLQPARRAADRIILEAIGIPRRDVRGVAELRTNVGEPAHRR